MDECNHIIGFVDDIESYLVYASDRKSDYRMLAAFGERFEFCPECGEALSGTVAGDQ